MRVSKRSIGRYLLPLGVAVLFFGVLSLSAETVATLDGEAISRAEVEDRIAGELRELEKRRHQLLDTALRALIDERIVLAAAEAAGVSPAAVLGSDQPLADVTPEEIDAWYEANKARVRQPKDAVAAQIKSYLEQERRQQQRQSIVADLRQDHEVEIRLDPLRIELGSGPAAVRGEDDAAVTLTIFSDFQCPYCKQIVPELKKLEEQYADTLQVVFRHFPLKSIHPRASAASEAAICAEEQGGFWEMHDGIFASQNKLDDQQLRAIATDVGLDVASFDSCVASPLPGEQLAADLEIGRRAGVSSTPSLFVNGRPVVLTRGRAPSEIIGEVVDDELARSTQGP